MSTVDRLARKLSRFAAAEAEAVIQALSSIEPDLAAIATALGTAPAETFAFDRKTAAWKGLYLSIYELPRRIVLVGSIDNVPELAGLPEETNGLLIVETDSHDVSTAELLPRGTLWRSLAEFGTNLTAEDQFDLVMALINHLQPGAVLVMGSLAGWNVLARNGGAIRCNTELFAAVAAVPGLSAADVLRKYLRSGLPALSSLYGPDERALHRIAELFRLTPGERGKLRNLGAWGEPGGFFSAGSGQ